MSAPRRWRRLLWLIPALAVLGAVGVLLATPLAADYVKSEALPRLADRLGRRVDVREVRVRWGRVELTELTVDGAGAPTPLTVPRAQVHFRVLPLLLGRISLSRVVLERPHIELVRSESGEDNVSALLDQLRAARKGSDGAGDEGKGRRRGPDEIQIIGGTLAASDDALGTFETGSLDALVRREGEGRATLHDLEIKLTAGPSARARKLEATFAIAGGKLVGAPSLQIEGGDVRVWKGFAVSGVQGGITPQKSEAPDSPGSSAAPDPAAPTEGAGGAAPHTRFVIDLEGGYGGVDKILWSAKGRADPSARQGELHLVAARFDLGQLAPVLVDTPILHPSEAEVDAGLDLVFRGDNTDPKHLHDALDFDGRLHLSGLTVFHPKLGPQPVRHIGFNADAKGRLEPRAHTLHVESAGVDFRGVKAHLALDVSKLEKLGRKRKEPATVIGTAAVKSAAAPPTPADFPAFTANLVVDPVSCQTVLEALPPELVPHLRGFRLDGTFKSEIHAAIDTDKLDEMDLGSNVGIDGCRVVAAPPAFSADRLDGNFQHAVEVEPGNWITFAVGSENPNFVPFDNISKNLVNSIMTTEDSNYFQHRGFIGREFKSALRTNLEHGYFRLGASSITMQMVKNVLLSREKTLSRKLQEMFLTWYLERHLSKSRILEIYFNVIEFGPGIFGIGRAAHHYFGKPARDLLPREAAFFSSILPNPKKRYTHYCNGPDLDEKWETYLNRILRRMHERGRLTDSEYETASTSHLRFDRKEAQPKDKCLEIVRRITAVGPGGQRLATVGDSLPSAANSKADDNSGTDAPGLQELQDPGDPGLPGMDDPPPEDPGSEP